MKTEYKVDGRRVADWAAVEAILADYHLHHVVVRRRASRLRRLWWRILARATEGGTDR